MLGYNGLSTDFRTRRRGHTTPARLPIAGADTTVPVCEKEEELALQLLQLADEDLHLIGGARYAPLWGVSSVRF